MAYNFTSYQDLLQKMRDDLASDAWRTLSSYSVKGSTFSYRSFKEWQEIFQFVQGQAALETGVAPYRGRLRAGQGGK